MTLCLGAGSSFLEEVRDRAMPSEKNQQLLREIIERLSRCTIAITTNYSGLSVSAVNEVRRRLREQQVEYRVVKNTLTILAGKTTGKEGITEVLDGPTAIAFGYGDPLVPAKVLDEYIRATRSSLTIQGGVMDGRVLQGADVLRLASLPPRDELMARLAGQLQAPISGLASVLQAPLRSLATVLQRRVEQEQGSVAAG